MTDTPAPPVTLLGPQRRPTVEKTMHRLGLLGRPVATVTAGWQDREMDDPELDQHLGGATRNLELWQRWQHILDADPQLAEADRRRREMRSEVQDLYLLGVGHAMAALIELYHLPHRTPALVQQAIADADEVLHDLDVRHLGRIAELESGFYERYPPHERPDVARHRAEVAAIVADCEGVVLTGGHVAVLLDLLHLFNVAPLLASRPVVAWSAGAMVLTDRVVLFNDRATHGHAYPEVFGAGLGLVRDVVALPAARQRLLLGDRARMASLARRFAPSWCLPLEPGSRVELDADYRLPATASVIGGEGELVAVGELAYDETVAPGKTAPDETDREAVDGE
ncbi:hypothetical protein FB554_3002 [Barrientosiimonas humi]|uniref:Uncharacterized protein n=1 Tax=Barrientosiimonas humi TaxID=999931 RepID=A0A542XG70_9MICO|nr:hypothetical protein [Barrientosiimonas humi]TQL34821.1 hypothetical protein FB554_3002 [Barrientosiimonas humi]CAG7570956.1 hypothetical protein BH39T_PBIAJDOK_00121 [Barrientosiimonas humi]